MKKRNFALCAAGNYKLLMALLFVFSGLVRVHAQRWSTVGSSQRFTALSLLEGAHSMALDESGAPYVAYNIPFGNSNFGGAGVMRFDGSSWIPVGTHGGFSEGTAAFLSIAISSIGIPYVVFSDGVHDEKATVMKYEGGVWLTVGILGFSTDLAHGFAGYISPFPYVLVLDLSGTPYVAFTSGAESEKATVMKFDGVQWVTVGKAGFSEGGARFLSMAIDASGTPYVAYQDRADGDKAKVMKFDGGSWIPVGGACSTDSAQYTSIAIASNGRPYVVYSDGTQSQKATVMEYNGYSWIPLGSPGFSTGSAASTKLVIDGNDVPYVIFQDGNHAGKATVMKYGGAGWVTEGNAGFSNRFASAPAITVDNEGTPYMIYYTEILDNRVPEDDWGIVMRFEKTTGIEDVGNREKNNLTLSPSPNRGAFAITGSLLVNNKEASVTVRDMLGRRIYQGTVLVANGVIDAVVNLNNVASGLFTVTVSSGSVNKTFQVMVEP